MISRCNLAAPAADELSASKNGFRFVGRWAQECQSGDEPEPVL